MKKPARFSAGGLGALLLRQPRAHAPARNELLAAVRAALVVAIAMMNPARLHSAIVAALARGVGVIVGRALECLAAIQGHGPLRATLGLKWTPKTGRPDKV